MKTLLVTREARMKTIDRVATGARIREARKLIGMRQYVLAKRIGISPTYMNNIESGRRLVTPKVVAKIEAVLKKEKA